MTKRKKLRRQPIKHENGRMYKLCYGPRHPPEGKWVPEKGWSRYRTGERAGTLVSQCNDCRNMHRVLHDDINGLVPVTQVRFIFLELANRVGTAEAARMLGMTRENLSAVLRKKRRYTGRRWVRRAILELRVLRAANIAYHRNDIRRGITRLREEGQDIRIARRRGEFYSYEYGAGNSEQFVRANDREY